MCFIRYLLVVISVFVMRMAVANPEVANGDVNGDGVVNMGDVSLVHMHVLGNTALDADAIARADIYPDGKITMSDIVLLNNRLLEGE